MAEQGGHVGSEVFVVLVDGGQPGRDVVVPADVDAGEDRGDNVVPEGEQGGYCPGGRAGQIVAAGAREFADELLAAEFAQIVGGPYPLRWTPDFSCPIRRESEKWVRHAAHIRRSTRRSR